jgi:hypothetical protein
MHTLEVTILKPEAEAMLDEMEQKDLIKLEHGTDGKKAPLQRGSIKGLVEYISVDFDEPLDDFADYV